MDLVNPETMKYPVRSDAKLPPMEHDHNRPLQFDLVVIGMQEATFDPPRGSGSVDEDDTIRSIRVQVPVVQPILKKTVRGVSNLTATRDHTRKNRLMKIQPSDWEDGTKVLHELLDSRLPSYKRCVSYQRGQMRLEVYVLSHHSDCEVEVLHIAAQNTGRAGLANKGGIATELLINGTTRFSFLTAHLEAHEGAAKYATRCSTVGDILNGTKSHRWNDLSMSSHFSFFMGDLNFRTDLGVVDEGEHKERVRQMVLDKDWDALNEADELRRALRQKDCLVGYQTLLCNFPPTFKLEREAGFAYVDKRLPSYTDRVLWKTAHQLESHVHPILYEPIDTFESSDHKPVRAAFCVKLNEPFRMRPRLSRHESVRFTRRSLRQKHNGGKVASLEHLHIFISKMKASFLTNEGKEAPDPYISFITSPAEVLQEKTTRWNRFTSRVLFRSTSKVEGDGFSNATSTGWPCTTQKKATFTPDWGEEEIRCEIRTHKKDGSPYNLSGALLFLTIMNHRSSAEDTLLGSVTLNLEKLLRSTKKDARRQQSVSEKSPRSGESLEMNPEPSTTETGPIDPEPTGSGSSFSFRNIVRLRRLFKRSHTQEVREDEEPLQTFLIDEPVLLNGREQGRLQCTIEAWWMDERTSRLVDLSADVHKHREPKSTIEGDGVRLLLGTRHNDRLEKKESVRERLLGGAAR